MEVIALGLDGERFRQRRADPSAARFDGDVDAALANACVARPVAVGGKAGPPDDPAVCFGDKERIAVSVVCLVFLFHLPSALVVILTLPVATIMSFICMFYLGVTSNVMSLCGIAIAIGAMVDAAIIMVENAHKKLEEWEAAGEAGKPRRRDYRCGKGSGAVAFLSLLVITVGFLPVFTLQAQAGRLFKPLAYTKTFAMLFSSLLAVTLTPMLMTLFIRGKIRPEEKNPVSMILHRIYEPVAHFALRFKKTVIVAALVIMAVTVYPFMKLGTEFMPPLYEGTLFYMPVTVPAASISEASNRLVPQQRAVLLERRDRDDRGPEAGGHGGVGVGRGHGRLAGWVAIARGNKHARVGSARARGGDGECGCRAIRLHVVGATRRGR